jgi:hypothetical protein
MDTPLEIEAANAGLLAPSATDLTVMFENGDVEEATARIQTLGLSDFIEVLRVVRQLDNALSSYAMSWKSAAE